MHNYKTAQEIIEAMQQDDDELPDFTLEQLDLAEQGKDSFIQDGMVFDDSGVMPVPHSRESQKDAKQP